MLCILQRGFPSADVWCHKTSSVEGKISFHSCMLCEGIWDIQRGSQQLLSVIIVAASFGLEAGICVGWIPLHAFAWTDQAGRQRNFSLSLGSLNMTWPSQIPLIFIFVVCLSRAPQTRDNSDGQTTHDMGDLWLTVIYFLNVLAVCWRVEFWNQECSSRGLRAVFPCPQITTCLKRKNILTHVCVAKHRPLWSGVQVAYEKISHTMSTVIPLCPTHSVTCGREHLLTELFAFLLAAR